MSFDEELRLVFCTEKSQSLWNRAMSFDLKVVNKGESGYASLNPFGTGQCLSTMKLTVHLADQIVSIPLEQGNVFRPAQQMHLI